MIERLHISMVFIEKGTPFSRRVCNHLVQDAALGLVCSRKLRNAAVGGGYSTKPGACLREAASALEMRRLQRQCTQRVRLCCRQRRAAQLQAGLRRIACC